MASLRVENLTFHFQPNFNASRYDTWEHYLRVLQPKNQKAVDIVATRVTTRPPECWLVEVKDFRILRGPPGAKNTGDLAQTVMDKARDTLKGLKDAAKQAKRSREKESAELAVRAEQIRIVLHMEPYSGTSALFRKTPSAANVQQKLRQIVSSIDPKTLVLSIATTPKSGVPWTTTTT